MIDIVGALSRQAARAGASRARAGGALAAPRMVAAVIGLTLAGCGIPPRGYYAPEGLPLGKSLVTYTEESADAQFDARCQGAYVDTVDGQDVLTVHFQFDIARPRSGDLTFPRDAVVVDVERAGGGPTVELALSEAWSGREPVAGDLVVASWTRRPFDLFFDSPELSDDEPPSAVLLRWSARATSRMLTGETRFELIPPGDPHSPSDEPPADKAFGMRDGYYLPGRIALGVRELQPSTEERQHYIFHSPRTWGW